MTKFKFPHYFRPKKWQSTNFQAVSEYFQIISFGIPNSIRKLLLRVVPAKEEHECDSVSESLDKHETRDILHCHVERRHQFR
jgi:hypothetical protein